MDGTPVDNNRLVLAPFLNTLTVRACPSLSASQYPKDSVANPSRFAVLMGCVCMWNKTSQTARDH